MVGTRECLNWMVSTIHQRFSPIPQDAVGDLSNKKL